MAVVFKRGLRFRVVETDVVSRLLSTVRTPLDVFGQGGREVLLEKGDGVLRLGEDFLKEGVIRRGDGLVPACFVFRLRDTERKSGNGHGNKPGRHRGNFPRR